MPLLGAHMSVAGGLYKAVQAAAALSMDTVQIFTHSPSQWSVKPVSPAVNAVSAGTSASAARWQAKELPDEQVRHFQAALAASRVDAPIAHDSYLINLAAADDLLWRRSIEAMTAELQRAEQLGIAYVVMHPGSYTTTDEEQGLARIIEAIDLLHARLAELRCRILLETTAGQGTNLGWRFEHLAAILDGVKSSDRLGVCFDTCHVFAAGYPLQAKQDYTATMKALDRLVGLERIKAFHLNDSKRELGSRVDRHEKIGAGFLGLAPFAHLVNDRRFRDVPMYLETPKGKEKGRDLDAINLATLRGLLKKR